MGGGCFESGSVLWLGLFVRHRTAGFSGSCRWRLLDGDGDLDLVGGNDYEVPD